MNAQKPACNDAEYVLQVLLPSIPSVVGQVCASLGHHLSMADRDDVVQRIVLLLIDDNYRVLRSFDHCSRPQTWLYTIVRRHILLRLRDKGSTVSLDDVSSDFFTVQPDQEQWLLTKEREELLQTAVSNLTKREQMLFGLIRQGLDAEKVGEEMKIKRRSASVMKRLLIKKLQRIVRGK